MSKRDAERTEHRCDPASTGRAAPAGTQIRTSHATRWRVFVLIAVHVLFALHLWHLYATGESITPLEPSESMQLAERSVINAGLIFFAITILSTLIFGRFFCGWACHLLALQDLSLALLRKLGIKPNPLRSRALMVVPVLAGLYMFAWPAVYRLWTGSGPEFQGVELTTGDFWETFPHPAVAIATFVVCGFIIVYFMGAKGFCTYACPYGALFAAADKFSPGRIRVNDDCDQCGHCTITCTSNVAVAQEVRDWGMVKDSGCMKCLDCVSVCPTNALSFGFGHTAFRAQPTATPRPAKPKQLPWEELFLALAFAAAFLASRGLWVMDLQQIPFLFALGIAGIGATLALAVLRLATRPDVRLQQLTLKRAGKRTRAGTLTLALAVPLALLWAHSGVVRAHEHQAASLMQALEPSTHGWFDEPRAGSDADFVQRAQELRDRAQWLQRWAIVEGAPNVRRRIWSDLWLGDAQTAESTARDALLHGLAGVSEALLLGDIALARGDAASAAEHYLAIHERRPDLVEVTAKAVPLLAELGAADEALRVLEGTLASSPDNVLLLLQHASVSMMLGRIDTVEATLRHAIDVAPDRPEPRGMLEQFLSQLPPRAGE